MRKKIADYLYQFLIINCSLLILVSCSVTKQISKSAQQFVIKDSSLLAAHVGISIYEPATNKYWYNYQGDKYFTPASNTKLATCYAAMKYLGDSLVALRYQETKDALIVEGTGDPSFLNDEFIFQPAFQFLKKSEKSIHLDFFNWDDEFLGSGWSWNDYMETYMAHRNSLPMFGNLFKIKVISKNIVLYEPGILKSKIVAIDPEGTSIKHRLGSNDFIVPEVISRSLATTFVPYFDITEEILSDTLHKKFVTSTADYSVFNFKDKIHSQPTDSLLKITMHRSDNFFAEQTLLMVSNEKLGVMNDEKIIDTLLKTDLKDLPQKPHWVDGSGLSRYDLFTPQDFVSILNKIKNEFGMERIKIILPTGNTGTLANYYKAENNFIFAKTGTLSGVVAISGYLYTKKNKLLIFSVLVNNHQSSATAVRRAVEKFIEGIRNSF